MVEPLDGPELDRLITALLNATGAVRRVVEEEDRERDPGMSGEEVIGCCAMRLRAILSIFLGEDEEGEELVVVTDFLALATLLIAQEGGFADTFRPETSAADRELLM